SAAALLAVLPLWSRAPVESTQIGRLLPGWLPARQTGQEAPGRMVPASGTPGQKESISTQGNVRTFAVIGSRLYDHNANSCTTGVRRRILLRNIAIRKPDGSQFDFPLAAPMASRIPDPDRPLHDARRPERRLTRRASASPRCARADASL